jgi:3-oxoacyl-[acyl-carrier protein] reductase
MTAQSLEGKVAIVTGASRGIDRAIALRLAAAGARLVLTARDEPLLAQLAEEIRGAGGEAIVSAGDLRLPETASSVAEHARQHFHRIDILVNNAGATPRGRFVDLTEEQWMDGFALKFFGAVRLTRHCWPELSARQGSVVNIAGIGGRTPGAEFTVGGSVNAALLSFTKALAEQGVADGVRVNAINPGRIKTDRLTRRLRALAAAEDTTPDAAEAQMIEQAGITRFGEPEEIAELVAYLVSPHGQFFQGSLIDIDGGETKGF